MNTPAIDPVAILLGPFQIYGYGLDRLVAPPAGGCQTMKQFW